MRIALLPLDSRPCNLVFPVQLAAWCGAECAVPAPQEMDDYTAPASFQASRRFLEREAPVCDAVAVSLDHLCYGSLLASREDAVSPAEARARLAWLGEFAARHPATPIHAFSVILRTTVSTLSLGDVDIWRAVAEYSEFCDRAELSGDPEDAARAEAAKGRIPRPVLDKFFAVRGRNHEINRWAVAMAREGTFASLLLRMEDSQEYGFHRREQLALRELIGGDSRVFLHNGADESGALAVARALSQSRRARVDVRWLGRSGGDFTALYEDRPFRENVAGALAYAGLEACPDAECALAIAAPGDGIQTESALHEPRDDAREIAEGVSALMDEGRHVYLLDVIGANGGNLQMMEAIRGPERLCGYSAWNTASNSLGTAVAQIISDNIAGRANIRFRNERILDDLIYQSVLRQRLMEKLREAGEDPFRIRDKAAAEALLAGLLQELSSPLLSMLGKARLTLPWNRAFEAEAHCGLEM